MDSFSPTTFRGFGDTPDVCHTCVFADWFSLISGCLKGFYNVYGALFTRIANDENDQAKTSEDEEEAPPFGSKDVEID